MTGSIARALAWAALAACAGCNFPGVRPEGQQLAVHGSAPASPDAVYSRAKGYYARNGYTTTLDRANERIVGYTVIERTGESETRAVLDFTITRGAPTETQYRILSTTEVGRPPVLSRAEQNAPAANSATGALSDWLSCGSARWPACP